jgi:hypothetical protein
VSHIFAAIMFEDDCGTKNPIRTACLYDGGKIESPLRFWEREINCEAVGSPTQAKVFGALSVF